MAVPVEVRVLAKFERRGDDEFHQRTMHPTDEERALLDHHCARVTDAFRARCAAVDAFWADLS